MYANTVVPFGSRFGQGADFELLRAVRTIIALQTSALILINLQLFRSDVRFGSKADLHQPSADVCFTPIADIGAQPCDVCFVPTGDIATLGS
jgi:hypothetical protein